MEVFVNAFVRYYGYSMNAVLKTKLTNKDDEVIHTVAHSFD